jgi:uncharacterized protein (DUF983 family)
VTALAPDPYQELAPLFALGALDGEDRAGFVRHLPYCPSCIEDVQAHEAVCARLAAAHALPAASELRTRVMTAARPPLRQPSPVWLPLAVAASLLAMASSAGLFVVRTQRDRARVELAAAQDGAAAVQQKLAALQPLLDEARGIQTLVASAGSRSAHLTGHPEAAPRAAAFIVWNPGRNEAILVVSGLPPAPEGKAYEVWAIAQGTPSPAGVFQADADGSAAFRIRNVDTARAQAFAVTLEPARGTAAPTGPMVLADRS